MSSEPHPKKQRRAILAAIAPRDLLALSLTRGEPYRIAYESVGVRNLKGDGIESLGTTNCAIVKLSFKAERS
ncbi:hypothetical protein CQ12_31660 [Bradyrhizobium jicamae]|uniref:Uncharacterized protein n=1 Tax=Bradyrhizobium jicamae TaxID=280332 RepID=A0A0R3LY61_9BRAD|nr:hypothetical protein CQ12_31660 [Bradyrhizobium jicamae]